MRWSWLVEVEVEVRRAKELFLFKGQDRFSLFLRQMVQFKVISESDNRWIIKISIFVKHMVNKAIIWLFDGIAGDIRF